MDSHYQRTPITRQTLITGQTPITRRTPITGRTLVTGRTPVTSWTPVPGWTPVTDWTPVPGRTLALTLHQPRSALRPLPRVLPRPLCTPPPCPGVASLCVSPLPTLEQTPAPRAGPYPGGSRLTMFMTVRMNLWAASAPWYCTMSASATTRVSTVCSLVSRMAFLRCRPSHDGRPLLGFFFSRKQRRHSCSTLLFPHHREGILVNSE